MTIAVRVGRPERAARAPFAPVPAVVPLLAEAERPFRDIFTGSPVGIAVTDETGRLADVNDALCTLLGRTRAHLLGGLPPELTRTDHLGSPLDTAAGAAPSEVTFVGPDGSRRWASLTAGETSGPQGQPWRVTYVVDVTARRSAEAALRDSEAALREAEAGVLAVGDVWRAAHGGADPRPVLVEKLGELARASTVSLVERDGADLVVTASLKADLDGTRISMRTPSATVWVWKSARELFLGDATDNPLTADLLATVPGAKSILWQPLVASGVVSGVVTVVWTHEVESLSDRAARAVTLLAHEGARALVEWNRRTQLESDVLTDALTGLPNRRSWDFQLARAVAEAAETQQPLTVAMVDLDHFKRFNDEFGHLAGDRLLVEFSQAAQSVVRGTDLATRWGGEEFAILLPGCPPEAARAVLERLRGAVPRGQHCSIGYSTWNGSESVDELTTRADQALYLAKHSGRNMVAAL